jgi:hypothetical protein
MSKPEGKKITRKSLAWMDRRIMKLDIEGGAIYGVEWSGLNCLRTGTTGGLF